MRLPDSRFSLTTEPERFNDLAWDLLLGAQEILSDADARAALFGGFARILGDADHLCCRAATPSQAGSTMSHIW